MGIRAVVFDVGGVLVHEEPVERLVDAWHDRSGVDRATLGDLLAGIDPVATSTGTFSERDLAGLLADRLGLDDRAVGQWMGDLWDWYCGTPNDSMLDYARGLRPGLRTAILTNSLDGARREEERRLALSESFDVLVHSHEIGLAKPDPGSYRHTLDLLGCTAQQTIFVDDRMENVDAARDLGLRAVHYTDSVSARFTLDRLLDRG